MDENRRIRVGFYFDRIHRENTKNIRIDTSISSLKLISSSIKYHLLSVKFVYDLNRFSLTRNSFNFILLNYISYSRHMILLNSFNNKHFKFKNKIVLLYLFF
jgi:hypothetical protein